MMIKRNFPKIITKKKKFLQTFDKLISSIPTYVAPPIECFGFDKTFDFCQSLFQENIFQCNFFFDLDMVFFVCLVSNQKYLFRRSRKERVQWKQNNKNWSFFEIIINTHSHIWQISYKLKMENVIIDGHDNDENHIA